MSLINRFQDKKVLLQELLKQRLVQNNQEVAEKILADGELVEFEVGQDIITQNNYDQDVFFIIAGEAKIIINGNTLNYTRTAGVSIGEMSVVNPSEPRLATIRAKTTVVAVKINATSFQELMSLDSNIAILLAKDMAARLSERNNLLDECNQLSRLFIISTSESLSIAKSLKVALDHEDIEVTIWSEDGVFNGGDYTLEVLEREIKTSDFGIAILHPDDVTISREVEEKSPRDNVIFELGLFMGLLKRQRTFIALPRGLQQKMASDLRGLTPFEYKFSNKKADVSTLAIKLAEQIKALGPRDKLGN